MKDVMKSTLSTLSSRTEDITKCSFFRTTKSIYRIGNRKDTKLGNSITQKLNIEFLKLKNLTASSLLVI